MAYKSGDNLSEEHAKFEAGQRKLLEQIADTRPEDVLVAAEGIKVLRDGVAAKIEATVPNHILLFQRALAKEAQKHPAPEAFVRAFEGVYGMFVFEQHSEDAEDPESKFVRMLAKVLSHRIEATDGTVDAAEKKSLIALRSELEAISKRLHMLDKSVTDETDEEKMTIGDKIVDKMKKAGVTGKKPSEWVLEQAFPGVKIEDGVVKIRGFETNFKHVAKVLKAAQEYFESPEEVPKVRDLYQNLVNLTGKTGKIPKSEGEGEDAPSPLDKLMKDAHLDAGKSINSQLPKLKQQIESKKEQRLSKPSPRDISLAVDAKRRENPGLDEAKARKAVIDDNRNAIKEVNDPLDEEISNLEQIRETLEEVMQKTKELHEKLAKFIEHLEVADKAEVKIKNTDDAVVPVAEIIARFKKISIKSADFNVNDLLAIYHDLGGYFVGDTNVSNLADSIRKAQEEIAKSTNLSDAKAAKKILGVMINEQMPDMPVTEQGKLAQLTLSKDVAVIQSKRDHRELAEKAGAEFLDLAQVFGFRTLVELKFKIGEKESHPFKDMKPADFMDEAKIRDHFSTGKFNLDNGFLVLAALEIFAGGGGEAAQYAVVEEELRNLIAAELGVKERQDEAGAESIISSAFEDYIKKSRPLVAKFFSHYDRNRQEWDGNKIKELNARYKELNESLRRGEISNEIYTKRRAELLEETQNVKMLDQVDYSESTIMDEFWHSKEAQWLRDLGVNTGKFAGKKALRGVGKVTGFVAGGVTKAVGSRVAGVAGVGAMGTWKSALGLVKYPALIAAKPLVGFINLFRKEKWTPLPRIRDSLRGDVAEVFGTYGKVKESMYGTLDSGLKRDWKPIAYESTKYADRSKVKPEELRKQIEEFKAKGSATAIEIGEVKVDMQKYKDQLKAMDEHGKEAEKKAA